MKKFWEKHDLLKIAGIMILITVILTWLIPGGSFSGTEMVIGDITRVGIFDFFTYGLLGVYYFTSLVTFLFVLGGFYQVLSRASGYQKLTDSIAKKFKGKEIFFVLVVSFIIAALTAVMNEYFVLIAFIPFLITIISKMKLDKITGFATTFGAILVGVIGNVYSSKVVGLSVSYLSVEYKTFLWVKLVLFAAAFILFSIFTILHMRKTAKKANEIEDLFIQEEAEKKGKVWPATLILVIFALVSILAYMPWETVFNTTFFAELTTNIMEYEVLGTPIFANIFGNLSQFGEWDIFGVQVLMLMTAIVIKWVYKIKTADFFTAFGEGFKKSGKLVVVMLAAFLVVELAIIFPVVPVIADWIMTLTSKFNVILGTAAGLVASLFSVEYQYTINLVGSYFATLYADYNGQVAIMLQSTYGLIGMFAPTSAILLIGLSYLGITYKEWFKYIWKFLLLMLVVIITLLLIIF